MFFTALILSQVVLPAAALVTTNYVIPSVPSVRQIRPKHNLNKCQLRLGGICSVGRFEHSKFSSLGLFSDGCTFAGVSCNRLDTSLSLSSTAASTSASDAPTLSNRNKTILATTVLVFLDTRFRALFTKYSVPFPPSLAGCGVLFSSMILLNMIDGEWGENVYQTLNPGAALLAKWLPVFFVPSLITLPLASGLGSALEVLKIFSIIIGGFLVTLLSTSW